MDDRIVEHTPVAVVVIGRNEGERLQRCLRSIPGGIPVVYVDSGSTDGSVAFARAIGITALPLDMSIGFTAARARNVGWRHFAEHGVDPEFIQFVDGDCELEAGWIDKAVVAIRAEPCTAAVFGRLRERFLERSIYNRLCDDEWNVPIGPVAFCGGIALFRTAALQVAGGFSDDLIAGEEPDLCLRLDPLGWNFVRIDAEMALHDANILTFGGWWKRTKRGGFAYAAHVLRHRARSIPQWRRQLKSISFWGFGWPVGGAILALVCGLWQPLAGILIWAAIVGSYIVQFVRIAARKRRSGSDWQFATKYGAMVVVGKFAEFSGAFRCWVGYLFDRKSELIEYKRPS